MPTIEERVAFIEGQMSEQSHALIESAGCGPSLVRNCETPSAISTRRWTRDSTSSIAALNPWTDGSSLWTTRSPVSSSGSSVCR